MTKKSDLPITAGILEGGSYVKQKSGEVKLESRTLNTTEAKKEAAKKANSSEKPKGDKS